MHITNDIQLSQFDLLPIRLGPSDWLFEERRKCETWLEYQGYSSQFFKHLKRRTKYLICKKESTHHCWIAKLKEYVQLRISHLFMFHSIFILSPDDFDQNKCVGSLLLKTWINLAIAIRAYSDAFRVGPKIFFSLSDCFCHCDVI